MLRTLAFLLVPMLSACGGQPTIRIPLRAPDPSGCYAIVYEQPNFQGAADVLNGPARLLQLTALAQTNYGNWANRIRSLALALPRPLRCTPMMRSKVRAADSFRAPMYRASIRQCPVAFNHWNWRARGDFDLAEPVM